MNKILTLICFTLIVNITRIPAAAWVSLGGGLGATTEEVKAIAFDPSGNMYVGGTFTGAINYVAKWNGSTWTALGTGVDGPVYSIAIKTSSDMYFGGSFSNAGGSPAANVAHWNGSAWNAVGSGFNGIVRTLFASYNGTIYAGGEFSASGSTNMAHIAKLVSPSTWTALGSGIASNVNAISEYPASVAGFIYAGTDFTGGAAPVMKYDGSSSWSAVGSLTGGRCLALAVFANLLYAGGDFSQPSRAGAKFDGTSWGTMVTNFGNTHIINVLYSRPDALYVGGNFTGVGVNQPNYIARVTTSLNPLVGFTTNSELTNGEVKAIGKSSGYVIAGGHFQTPTTPATNNISITSTTINVDEIANIVVDKNFYPNPAHGRATLTLKTTEPLKDPVLTVYDVQSKQVKASAAYNLHNNDLTVDVDLSQIPAGHYYYVLSSAGQSVASDIFVVE